MPYHSLAVFDVDGTLIREKTVCELIADRIGRGERMAWLEQNAGSLRTSLNAPENEAVILAREEMAEWYFEAGREAVDSFFETTIWAPGVHEGIRSLIGAGWLVALASMTWSFGVERIATDLGVSHFQGSDLDWETGRISHSFAEHKVRYLEQLTRENDISPDRVFAVGDSGGDIPMLKAAGRGVYLGDQDPKIDGIAHMSNASIDAVVDHILSVSS